ncbi:MAG TPA: RsmE family RNA methyltransferase, partial [Candidatus Binataceae bacterium]|nr:RsmE family RNA methyltransferase [Candidatus Binataceae bacterium]
AEVALLDEANVAYTGRIERFAPDHALIVLQASESAAKIEDALTLAVGLIKGPRMDFVVEKAAELGATELLPLLCQRSVVHAPGPDRIERWRRLATAAAKQSLGPRRMIIHPPLTVAGLVRDVSKETLAVVCGPGGEPLGPILRDARPGALTLVCGPEGGFAPEEVALMRVAGFREASLGRNRLRTETAALAALSIAAGARDELTGRG